MIQLGQQIVGGTVGSPTYGVLLRRLGWRHRITVRTTQVVVAMDTQVTEVTSNCKEPSSAVLKVAVSSVDAGISLCFVDECKR